MIKKNDAARAKMSTVFFEDDRIRNESQQASEQYLVRKEKENDMPQWMWYFLFFLLGCLFMISFDVTFFSLFPFFS